MLHQALKGKSSSVENEAVYIEADMHRFRKIGGGGYCEQPNLRVHDGGKSDAPDAPEGYEWHSSRSLFSGPPSNLLVAVTYEQRDKAILKKLEERGSPANPINAARAGWYAAVEYFSLKEQQQNDN